MCALSCAQSGSFRAPAYYLPPVCPSYVDVLRERRAPHYPRSVALGYSLVWLASSCGGKEVEVLRLLVVLVR